MIITEQEIQDLFPQQNLARGIDYAEAGYVKIVETSNSNVKSYVFGTCLYSVTLKKEIDLSSNTDKSGNELLDGTCSCPAYANHGPCKHMAATAYVISYPERVFKLDPELEDKIRLNEAFTSHLQTKTKEELIQFLVDIAAQQGGDVYHMSDFKDYQDFL